MVTKLFKAFPPSNHLLSATALESTITSLQLSPSTASRLFFQYFDIQVLGHYHGNQEVHTLVALAIIAIEEQGIAHIQQLDCNVLHIPGTCL